jgi:hypothetical protein
LLRGKWRRMRRASHSRESLDDLLIAGSYSCKKVSEIKDPEVATSQAKAMAG